ncbi:hypothetical protein DAI22_04g227750 [Oryza sativa Japonica Group]|nr:hypothetical protein DAI22_04g227750 [Oryza sativa Japonica Group]
MKKKKGRKIITDKKKSSRFPPWLPSWHSAPPTTSSAAPSRPSPAPPWLALAPPSPSLQQRGIKSHKNNSFFFWPLISPHIHEPLEGVRLSIGETRTTPKAKQTERK